MHAPQTISPRDYIAPSDIDVSGPFLPNAFKNAEAEGLATVIVRLLQTLGDTWAPLPARAVGAYFRDNPNDVPFVLKLGHNLTNGIGQLERGGWVTFEGGERGRENLLVTDEFILRAYGSASDMAGLLADLCRFLETAKRWVRDQAAEARR